MLSVTRRHWGRPMVAISVVFGALVMVALVTGCGDAVERISVDTPAVTPLSIPPLLEPTIENGVAHYDLTIGTSHHDYQQGSPTETYSYNGMSVLGPTLRLKTGDSVAINVTNALDQITTTHWHGADVPAEDDGGPLSPIEPGTTWVADFDVIQPAATLWYHPHLHGFTAEHVYRGSAGMIIVDDGNPAGTLLPRTYGVDDIPVIIQDRDFTEDGQFDFAINRGPLGKRDGVLTVNGTINPFVETPAGPVRLRLLNGSQARIYQLGIEGATMMKIASDGGYLASPVILERIVLGPGDRAEIIVDVGGAPAALVDSAFGRVLELRPTGLASTVGPLPETLTAIERISGSEITVDRSFHMDQVGNGWGFNGLQLDMSRIDETMRLGDTERWTLTAEAGQHVFHVHQTQFQILAINGEPPPPEEAGWEDSVLVNANREVVIASRFNTYADNNMPYMYHCHLLDHEELGMMGQFLVVE
ncbi:MAG: multicopper oxidase domain-containing protein [Chloroflexi bacterium]|nr:multicopper oxidase domain-containing protein [Chloroflexota bacterium]